MPSRSFAEQSRAVIHAYCTGLGAGSRALEPGEVAVVERPAQHWGFRAVGVAFSDRTLFSVEPGWLDRVRASAPGRHEHRALLDVLSSTRDQAVAQGESVSLHAPAICWALDTVPSSPTLPAGHRFDTVDSTWLNGQVATGRFENGAGQESGVDGREHRNLYGVALFDRSDEVIAVAGVFLTYGLHEIGVDVVEQRRGEGLGSAVVAAVVHEILERDAVPFYGCNPTNIRSMRTALSAGFLPVCADAAIT